jgi:CRISPR-associated endonuclease Csy4
MKYYIEVTLRPSTEIPLYFLWEKVYQQIHLVLVGKKNQDGLVSIGVSFPGYDTERNYLGNKLRIFAKAESDLEELRISKWLARFADYIHITNARVVPEKPQGYAYFQRVQTKSSTERLGRRKAKREGISLKAALKDLTDHEEKTSKLPYIRIKSLSSEKRYRLMISCTETDEKSCDNKFSTYGLGHNCSVPLF